MSVTEQSIVTTAHEQLLAEREELLRTLEECGRASARERSDVPDGIGETEHLVSAEQRELSDRLASIARASLSDVDSALARIDAGTYGSCAGCGQQIPEARLDAVPAAQFCVGCQSTHEVQPR